MNKCETSSVYSVTSVAKTKIAIFARFNNSRYEPENKNRKNRRFILLKMKKVAILMSFDNLR